MAIIRGKITSDKEVIPNVVNIGEPLFTCDGNGIWYKQDGSRVEIETKSLNDLLRELNIK